MKAVADPGVPTTETNQTQNATFVGLDAANTTIQDGSQIPVDQFGPGLELVTVAAGSMNPFTALGVTSAMVILEPSTALLSCSLDVQAFIRCQEVNLKIFFLVKNEL